MEPSPGEMKWHSVLFRLALCTCTATPFIALRRPQCKSRAHLPLRETPENRAWKEMEPVGQISLLCSMRKLPKFVPITEPKRKLRAGIEVPVPVEGRSASQLASALPLKSAFPLGRHLRPLGSGTSKAEQRKAPRLSASRDRLRERLRSTTPLTVKELVKKKLLRTETHGPID